jgi:WD40 repeat protein
VKAILPHRFSNQIMGISSRSSEINNFRISPKEASLTKLGELQLTHIDNYEGHSSCIYALCALVQDPQFIASGSDDKTIKIWDTNSGACVATLEGHQAYVRTVMVL